MKTFFAFTLFVMPWFIGVKGQTADTKTRIHGLGKPLDLEIIHGISHRGEKYEKASKIIQNTPGNKFKSAMTSDQKLDYTITASWDTEIESMSWLKIQYTYDDNGNLSGETAYEGIDSTGWGPNQWTASFKQEYHYNTNGQDTLLVIYRWDQSTRIWARVYESHLAYDDFGNVILAFDYDLDENNHQIPSGYKYEYTYNANRNVTLDSIYYRDFTTSQWILVNKDEYTYDTKGNVTSRIYYNLDDSINQWVYNIKIEYHYDDNGNTTSIIYNHWDENTSKWVGYNKIEYQYHTNGKKNVETYFDWTGSENQWDSTSWGQFTYDDNGNVTSFKLLSWDDYFGNWYEAITTDYYYSELNPTPVPGISGKEIRVYPNPAKEYIVFDITNISSSAIVELFDLQGKKVLEQRLYDNNRVQINKLSKGLYLYSLHDSGNVYDGKVTVE